MIFEEKYFSCYILLPDQILLSGCLYFVRYWAIRVLQFFVNKQPSCDVIHFEISLIFLIKSLFLTVFSYHVACTFQSEYTLYSSLNVKELLARSRRDIWRLSDCNGTRTYNHLVRKRTLNHLAVFVYKLSGCGFESHCNRFFYMTKKARQKFKYHVNKKSF